MIIYTQAFVSPQPSRWLTAYARAHLCMIPTRGMPRIAGDGEHDGSRLRGGRAVAA
jgi:hypothetical protein